MECEEAFDGREVIMSQTYPIGRDNLNQLIQLQLGTEAFDIIHKVADNMETLKKAIS